MQLPGLRIDKLLAKIPIIQGGMAVRVSTAPLAAAVANEGGIGVIAATGMSPEELANQIRTARSMTSGIIGINIMYAAKEFMQLVKTALDEGIDLVIQGAGFSRDIYAWGKEYKTPIVPIVSSAKLAKVAQKLGAAAVIVEGKEAGGHLGTDRSVRDIVPEVVKAVDIPVIAAGGIIDGYDIVEALSWGAVGVQMGTRFAASEECEASDAFKQLYLQATHDDIILINSPVGLPGRAVKNVFSDRLFSEENLKPQRCDNCLKNCSRNFCILKALNNAQQGFLNDGLVFAGECVEKIKEVLPVKKIFENIKTEIAGISLKEATES